jgi:hypothetical protein
VIFTLRDGSELIELPPGVTAAITIKNGYNGTGCVDACVIDHVNNTITYMPTVEALSIEGNIECTLHVFDADGAVIGGPTFIFAVSEGDNANTEREVGDALEASTSWDIIAETVSKAEAAAKSAKDAEDYANRAKTALGNATLKASEAEASAAAALAHQRTANINATNAATSAGAAATSAVEALAAAEQAAAQAAAQAAEQVLEKTNENAGRAEAAVGNCEDIALGMQELYELAVGFSEEAQSAAGSAQSAYLRAQKEADRATEYGTSLLVQETGNDDRKVMSQDASTKAFVGRSEVISYIVQEIAKIVANAPADFDTLKEIADYIASDKTAAAEINSKLSKHEKEILDNRTAIENLPELVQETGDRTDAVMSQKAVTEAFAVPDYVKTEADVVAKRILSLQNEHTFTFAVITDAHINYGNPTFAEQTAESIKHASMAINRVASQIGIDFMCNLGDSLWGSNEDVDLAKNEQLLLNQAIFDAFKGYPNFRLIGNHDANLWNYCIPTTAIYSMNGRYNTFDEVGQTKIRGYGYKDFEQFKVRVIGMNTSDYIDNKGGYYLSDEQMLWFMSALDLSNKTDAEEWQVLLLSHFPLDFPAAETETSKDVMAILASYKNGTSVTTNAGSYDYNGKNKAQIICNIHGHIHNFSRGLMENGVLRVCTPNTCFYNNGSSGTGVDANYMPNESYNKIAKSAKDTTVTFYTIDTENKIIYSTNYGAGYDRGLTYDGEELELEPFEEVVSDVAVAPRSQWTHTASTHDTFLGANNSALAIGVSTPNEFTEFTDRENNALYVMPVPAKAKKVIVTNSDGVAYKYGFMLYNAVDGLLNRVLDSGWTTETEYSFAKGVATYITISATTQDGAFVSYGFDDTQITVTFTN